MLFSKTKWNSGKEIGAYVPASASLGFDKMESSLQSAEDLFLQPLLGDDMMAAIESIYGTDENSRSEAEQQLLELAQRAEANLAMWYNFDALQLRITDQGFQRQGSDDWQQAYKYQEDRLREGFKNKGFNAIDRLLDFLDENADTFTDYTSSTAYAQRTTAIVRTTEEVQKWVNIGHSALMFLRFAAEFPTVEEDVMTAELGTALYTQLIAWLNGDEEYPTSDYDVTLEQFRAKCVRVMVMATAVRLLKQTGTLTDRGLYFEAVTAANTENRTRRPATDAEIGNRLEIYQADLRSALAALRIFVNENYSDFFDEVKEGHVIRDNDDHVGFFAM